MLISQMVRTLKQKKNKKGDRERRDALDRQAQQEGAAIASLRRFSFRRNNLL
jgi:hypothetical protein